MATDKKWFIPNDETLVPHGPFTTAEILVKIQEGSLKLDNHIWTEDGAKQDWFRLFEVEEFKNSDSVKPVCKIPNLAEVEVIATPKTDLECIDNHKDQEYGSENIYRRFPRAPFERTVILHNQDQGYLCSSLDICEKGLSIEVSKSMPFQPSDEVTLTIRDFPLLGTFSTEAVVLREFKVHDHIVLGLYFLRINPLTRRLIAQYVVNELKNGPKISRQLDDF